MELGRQDAPSPPGCRRTLTAPFCCWKQGPDYPDFDTLPDDLKLGNNVWLSAYGPHNWGYSGRITPEQPDLQIPRGRATGGSSAVNGQVLFRGIPEDYDRWAEWGNDEWNFVDCLPYFNRLETDLDFGGDDFHGSDGPVPVRRYPRSEWLPYAQAFEKACVAEGYPISEDQNHPESTGVSPRARNTINGVRMSMALNYLDLARHRLNLTVRGNVTARRIVFDGNGPLESRRKVATRCSPSRASRSSSAAGQSRRHSY